MVSVTRNRNGDLEVTSVIHSANFHPRVRLPTRQGRAKTAGVSRNSASYHERVGKPDSALEFAKFVIVSTSQKNMLRFRYDGSANKYLFAHPW